MKTTTIAALAAVASLAAAPALAQAQATAKTGASAATAPAAASAKISVDTTPIGDIIKNPAAKAALETALPTIPQYYDQIATMTLAQVAPMSQGAIDDAKLKALQAEFDKIK
ncbi:MAG: hypothetical protein JWQ46_718 [Phenylobacterium sp.]|nr:hypothetical protein [Phenylobacterium sp.]